MRVSENFYAKTGKIYNTKFKKKQKVIELELIKEQINRQCIVEISSNALSI